MSRVRDTRIKGGIRLGTSSRAAFHQFRGWTKNRESFGMRGPREWSRPLKHEQARTGGISRSRWFPRTNDLGGLGSPFGTKTRQWMFKRRIMMRGRLKEWTRPKFCRIIIQSPREARGDQKRDNPNGESSSPSSRNCGKSGSRPNHRKDTRHGRKKTHRKGTRKGRSK